jgi:hypothetical protein
MKRLLKVGFMFCSQNLKGANTSKLLKECQPRKRFNSRF